jgi:hypothetical protein
MKCREGSLIEMGRCNSNITLGAMKQRETQRSVLSKSQKLQDSHMTRVAVYIIETVFAIIIRTFQKLKLRMLLPSSPIFHATQIMGNGLCNCSTNLSALSFQLTGNLQDLRELRNLGNPAKLYESSQWAYDHHPTPLCCVLVSSGSSHFLDSVFGVRLQVKMGMISVGTCHKRQRKGNKIPQA